MSDSEKDESKTFAPEIKAKIGLAAVQYPKSIDKIAEKFGITSNRVLSLRDNLVINAPNIFEEGRAQAKENVQTLHGFIMVLAIGNAVREYAASHAEYLSSNPFSFYPEFNYDNLWSFSIGMILIFRFFLGDRLYIKRYQPKNGALFMIDMLNIFVSALLVAYLSFFVTTPAYLYLVATVLFASELVWWVLRSLLKFISARFGRNESNISKDDRLQMGVAQLITLLTLLSIGGFAFLKGFDFISDPKIFFSFYSADNLFFLACVFSINTVLELLFKAQWYFGSDSVWHVKLTNDK